MSTLAASYGAITVNSIVRPGVSTPDGGTQAKPSSGPTESPTAPCSCTRCFVSVSAKVCPAVSTTSR